MPTKNLCSKDEREKGKGKMEAKTTLPLQRDGKLLSSDSKYPQQIV